MKQSQQNKPLPPAEPCQQEQARTAILPPWLALSEKYAPPADADHYIGKSLFKILNRLEKLHQPVKKGRFPLSPVFKLLLTMEVILCISLSTHILFPGLIGTAALVYLALQPGRDIAGLLKKALLAAACTFVITVPAIWLGNPQSCLMLSGKTFLTVLLMAILAHSTQWNRITAALSMLHIPHLFIMTLDLTLHYISLLGNLSMALLQALQLRSVGKNDKKYQSLSGVLGITFLKSKEYSEETYQAMVCRCFTGSYDIPRTHTFHWTGVCYGTTLLLTALLYLWLERMIP